MPDRTPEHLALREELAALARERERIKVSPAVSPEYRAYVERLEAFEAKLDAYLRRRDS